MKMVVWWLQDSCSIIRFPVAIRWVDERSRSEHAMNAQFLLFRVECLMLGLDAGILAKGAMRHFFR